MHTYLITGGAGFIGSHLAEYLLAQGQRVLAIDNLSTGAMANIAHLLPNEHFRFARADVNDLVVLDRLASEAQVIIHLAAAVGVQLVVERPVHTIETNVRGTETILKAALRYGSRVLVASTSEVYGKATRVPFAEEDDILLGATSKSRWSYAASKMLDEFLALAYHREFGLDALVMRFFNTIGPRQSGRYGMVVPRFVRQALSNEPLTIYGDGQQARCFCDVRDIVRAVVALADHHLVGPERVFNLGNTREITITALAQLVKTLTGSSAELAYVPYAEAYAPGFEDMHRRVPDTTRINRLLGWSPTIALEETIGDIAAALQ
ncbi:MAG: NAD-dependent epimerase/dehydratase family protein [Chloroflexia bacterium]|nr:NAD-dependent epimerase/dehydratase family protein [Chloroflexia bacterium]